MFPFNSSDEYYQETFNGIELKAVDLREKAFEDCTFEKCQFDSVAIHFCKFIQCRFVECMFLSVKIPNCIFDEVSFKECKMSVFNWTDAVNLSDLQFEKCKLDSVQFGYMDIRRTVMRDCVLHAVDFSEANLSESDLSGSDLYESVFSHTNLTKVNFVGATRYAVDVNTNIIKKAQFSLPEAVSLLRGFDITIV